MGINVKNNNVSKHLMDIMFVLSLFCVFAVSSVILIILGADVYNKTTTNINKNYTTRTTIAYFTEKLRQSDTQNSFSIIDIDNHSVLAIYSIIDDMEYATYLYEYDGELCELFTRSDLDIPLDAGQKIMEIENLSFSKVTPTLICISFSNADNEKTSVYIALHCNNTV